MNHKIGNFEVDDKNKGSVNDGDSSLLQFTSGRGFHSGKIYHFLAIRRAYDTGKNRKSSKNQLAPSMVQVGDTTIYLNSGETITLQGHQFPSQIAMVNYRIIQHNASKSYYEIIDRSANRGIFGKYMLFFE
jgi:hypothetical protein